MSEQPTFPRLLRAFRQDAKATQSNLQTKLEKLNYSIDDTTLSKYEAGERLPPASFIPYFAKALNLSPQDEHVLLVAYTEDFRLAAVLDYKKGKDHVTTISARSGQTQQ